MLRVCSPNFYPLYLFPSNLLPFTMFHPFTMLLPLYHFISPLPCYCPFTMLLPLYPVIAPLPCYFPFHMLFPLSVTRPYPLSHPLILPLSPFHCYHIHVNHQYRQLI